MFTGIIEETGQLAGTKRSTSSMEMIIRAKLVLEDTKIGDSISVEGVCLTVTSLSSDRFTVDVMPETYHGTTLSSLSTSSAVNLERAMAANGRFGGHLVAGHVDGVGKILRKRPQENALYIDITAPAELIAQSIVKGSVAVDGISLTIFELGESHLTVSLIPHTAGETTLGGKKIGDSVNLETDMFGKYVQRFMEHAPKQPMNADYLRRHGF
ncbi:riboflavin synthase [Planococcus sp. ISL-109]|uniref:riboflavin synthase n=1 Tax=Planococcus sp. ISL-109 TaxID=2819166 RepID=UPI001BEBE9EF|nr:riboflavin synthase [Planococcus sp. ISL-109]MBT2581335.1 riboflavin synthase [Planococcus sp. ISL-109]